MNRRETLKLMGFGALSGMVVPRWVAAAPPGDAKTKTPSSKAFKECLTDVYHGEVLGESIFGEMLDAAKSPSEIYVLGSMLQMETEGKAILRPLLARLGLPLKDDAESRTHGVGAAANLNKLPWAERFAHIHESIEKVFLPRYVQLGELVSAQEDPEAAYIAAFMGSHERALFAATGALAKGAPDPIAPMTRLLRFPLVRP